MNEALQAQIVSLVALILVTVITLLLERARAWLSARTTGEAREASLRLLELVEVAATTAVRDVEQQFAHGGLAHLTSLEKREEALRRVRQILGAHAKALGADATLILTAYVEQAVSRLPKPEATS